MDAKFLIKEGFKNKVLITGNLKFSKENYENKTKQKKIKIQNSNSISYIW